ncbi:MAG: rRNA (Guanine745-N1)-methyltransferase [Hydrocarboniphaga sp.]|uniref:putative RNA methyltransferase n=1 Tax=Hydrocarboniphaga sp. TaxID=2033016 RepID=UPI00260FD380|nr:methyltransferase domain-containing protein [Hydrocarboniphaga sp.]MDB5972625.1 rRNA (Guanine745-N1)-methyltransferase [Hydrocarboniphaga sp.]
MPLNSSAIVCPLCRLPLACEPKVWRCAGGHSFDVARDGYVNLLPVQQKNSLDPGDSAESLAARRDFLAAGHYRPLRDAVLRMLAPLQAQRLLDLGCGEGYYTSAFPGAATEVIGLDIAKPAIQLAAKRIKTCTWLVASGAQLPVADGSLDVITCLFTQLHVGEMHRALRNGGHVLVVTPAPTHLWSLRAGLFDEVRAHQPDKFLAGFEAQFEVVARDEVHADLQLTQTGLRQLLAMTPYVWKARPEKRLALEQSECFETGAAFSLLLFKKR